MRKTTLFILVIVLAFSGCRQAPEEPRCNIVTPSPSTKTGDEVEELRKELGRLAVGLVELNALEAKILVLAKPLREAYQARFVELQPLAPLPKSFIGMLVGLDGKDGTSYRLALIPNRAFRELWHYSDALGPILRPKELKALQFDELGKDARRFTELVQDCSRGASWIGLLAAKTAGSDPTFLQLKAALEVRYPLEVLVELEEVKTQGLIPLQSGERKILLVEEVQNLQLSKVAKALLQGSGK